MLLRALEISDLPFLYQWENDADSWADSDIHNPLSQRLLREYIESSSGDIYRDGQLRLVIESDKHMIGCADLFDFDPRSGRAAVGLYISPEARGDGAGGKALALLEDYAFSFLGLHQLYAVIANDNPACIALFEKAGYAKSGLLGQWVKKRNGIFADAIIFQKMNNKNS